MKEFEIDHRLEKDCLVLGRMNISKLLLMNNALVPWLILVPRTSKTEITELSAAEQASLVEEINILSGFIKSNFEISKLNIASIGNIVSQLHIHVVGRHSSDYCWPGVVWGAQEKKLYTDEQVNEIVLALKEQLGDNFR
jgi:diadenosine tetraphosphate (Ap4A) HIT family hydrolase